MVVADRIRIRDHTTLLLNRHQIVLLLPGDDGVQKATFVPTMP